MSESIDLSARFGETTLTNFEIFMVGEALVRTLGSVTRLGHSSPASLLDYMTDPAALGLGGLIIRDFIAWTSGKAELAEGCEERMRALVCAADIDSELALSSAQRLTG